MNASENARPPAVTAVYGSAYGGELSTAGAKDFVDKDRSARRHERDG